MEGRKKLSTNTRQTNLINEKKGGKRERDEEKRQSCFMGRRITTQKETARRGREMERERGREREGEREREVTVVECTVGASSCPATGRLGERETEIERVSAQLFLPPDVYM